MLRPTLVALLLLGACETDWDRNDRLPGSGPWQPGGSDGNTATSSVPATDDGGDGPPTTGNDDPDAPPGGDTTGTDAVPGTGDATGDATGTEDAPGDEPERIVVMGDFHGDLDVTREALTMADAIDGQDRWIGGDLVLVQLGDQLDRGDDERAILDMLTRLEGEADTAGGRVHVLNGNHEVMNVALDFRYVTDAGMFDFDDVPGLDLNDPRLDDLPSNARRRGAAFLPGGPYAEVLAARNTVLQLGDTVFVHGGIVPSWANHGLGAINAEISAWMRGDQPSKPSSVSGDDSVVWSRHYSESPDASDCALLEQTLDILGAVRMIVGHTVQSHINPACGERVWRVDTGMSDYYGGHPEVLEIVDGVVSVIVS